MSAVTHGGAAPLLLLPGPSRHPLMAAIGLFGVISGPGGGSTGTAGRRMPGRRPGVVSGHCCVPVVWRGHPRKRKGGQDRIDLSFRWSTAWFIFSGGDVFAAFFGALPGHGGTRLRHAGQPRPPALWPGLRDIWLSVVADRRHGFVGGTCRRALSTMGYGGAPRMEHGVVAEPGVTLTIAHADRAGNRAGPSVSCG